MQMHAYMHMRMRMHMYTHMHMPMHMDVFEDRDAAIRARAADGKIAFGRHLRVDAATPVRDGGGATAAYDYKRCVFLGNLPFDAQDEPLWEM